MISPAVITSQAAQDDLNKIRGEHGDLLLSMADQARRVAEYHNQMDAQKAQRQQLEMERIKQDREYGLRDAELGIKRASLNTV